jgi:hypothetical protein
LVMPHRRRFDSALCRKAASFRLPSYLHASRSRDFRSAVLAFRGGGAVIVEGESLSVTHARLLAIVNELGRVSQFDEGYAIDADLAKMIPEDFISGGSFPRRKLRTCLGC